MQQILNLQYLLNLFDSLELDIDKLLLKLEFNSIEALDEALKQSLLNRYDARDTESHQYIIQSSSIKNSLSYIFSPFISAVLNQKTVYIVPQAKMIEQVYSHYFRLDAVHLEKQRSMQEMNLYLDLVISDFNPTEFRIYAICRALLDSMCKNIFLIGEIGLSRSENQSFMQVTKIHLSEIPLVENVFDLENIDLKALFWKKKSDKIADICHKISKTNAILVSQQFNIQPDKAQNLIDDLLYGEHVFEKLSVFGEFTDTILKYHHALK